MISLLYGKFRVAHIQFNTRNLVSEEEFYSVVDRNNYVLDLSSDYVPLYEAYSTNAKRNLKKALEYGEILEKELPVQDLLCFIRKHDVIQRSERDYRWLQTLLENLEGRGKGKAWATREGDQITAAAFFAFSNSRAIYLLSASSERGKDLRSMFRMVDAFIRENAGSQRWLDFEGSSIPSIARFFAGFGARAEVYQAISYNRLPRFLKIFHRQHG